MTQEHFRRRRILALDVRSTRMGYAVFEYESLLEAGITRFASSRLAERRLMALLRRFHPSNVVLRKISKASRRNCRGTRTIVRIAERVVKRYSVRVAFVSESQIRKQFKENATTKYQIASFLTHSVPALAWRLPAPRKAWEGEHRNMAIFDAAALGIAYLATISGSRQPRKE